MKKKRSLSSHLAIIALLLLFPFALVSAQTTVTINNLKYTLGGDTAVVSGYESKPTGDLVIPATMEQSGVSYQVTSIGYGAFAGCSGLTSVTLPEGITSLDAGAFYYCSGLTALTLPNTVTTIGADAFYYCYGLTNLTLSTGLTSIGERAFYYCRKLTDLTLPDGLTTIGADAFQSCMGLKTISLPSGLTTMGEGAFAYCYQLQEFTVTGTNTHFTTKDGILFNKALTQLISYPVARPSNSYILPNGVESIGSKAFLGCNNLSSISLPESLTTIGERAFEGCSNFTSITLPSRVATIGEAAFSRCSSLEEFIVSPQSSNLAVQDGILFNKALTQLISYPQNRAGTEYTLPTSITTIDAGAFSGCEGLTNVTLPKGLTTIGDEAFSNCSGLTTLALPQSVTTLGDNAFSYCEGITTLTLPEGLTTLGSYTFLACKSLKSLYLPLTLASSGKMVFAYCTALEEVHAANPRPIGIWSCTFTEVSKENCTLYVPTGSQSLYANAFAWRDFQNIVEEGEPNKVSFKYTLNSTDHTATITGYEGDKPTGDLTIPATITEGGVSYQVTAIGVSAFRSCKGLTTLTLPEPLKYVGEWAFSMCEGLTNISLPEGLTTLDEWAFQGCIGLTDVTLPEGLTTLNHDAFAACLGLTSFAVSEQNPYFATIEGVLFDKEYKELITYPKSRAGAYTVPSTVITLGNSAFTVCKKLTSITLPEGLTTIGEWVFYGCESLTNLSLPESLTTIGENALNSCFDLTSFTVSEKSQHFATIEGVLFDKNLKKLVAYPNAKGSSYTVPNGVTSIGVYAFSHCRDLTNIALPDGLKSIDDYAFYACENLSDLPLPEGLTHIGSDAFRWCEALTTITLPSSLTTLGNFALSFCKALTELHVPIATPLEINSNIFYGVSTSTCTLYVPIGSKKLYQTAEAWKEFQNIVEENPSGIINTPESSVKVLANAGLIVVEGAPEDATIAVYTLSGQLIACTTHTEIETPQRGIYIVRVGNMSFKVNVL